MTVNDVDLVMQPTADHIGFAIPPSLADTRLTFQHFNTNDPAVTLLAPHNSDAKQSDSNEWPPPLLFDIAYGNAVLTTWGVDDFKQFARENTRGIYYDENVEQPTLRRSERIRNLRNDCEAARQKKARNVGRRARNIEDDQEVDCADMLMGLWMRNAKKCPRQAHAKKVDRSREKVRTWLESAEL